MQYVTLQVDEWTIYLYATKAMVLMREARHHGQPLRGPYSFRKDGPHTPQGQYHIHVYRRQNQLFSVNFDGTAHDASHGKPIPQKVADALRQRFPDLILPTNNIIESDDGFYDFLVRLLD